MKTDNDLIEKVARGIAIEYAKREYGAAPNALAESTYGLIHANSWRESAIRAIAAVREWDAKEKKDGL